MALVFYLIPYTIIVLSCFPNSFTGDPNAELTYLEKNWNSRKTLLILNAHFKFIIWIFDIVPTSSSILVVLFLNMKFDENNNQNEITKTKTLVINNKSLKAEIKINQNLYLSRADQNNKFYKFKKIKIDGVTSGFFYIQLNNKALTDQLSLTDWEEYLKLKELFLKLKKIALHIYGVLFVSIPLLKMHLNNEYNYLSLINTYTASSLLLEQLYKPKFCSIFSSYGGFELGIVNSRFALYVIALFFILISMLKRAFYGGYTNYISSLIGFFASIIFLFQNIVYTILNFLMVLFSILSVVCYYDMEGKGLIKDTMIQVKLFIQIGLNFIIFSICMRILIDSIQLTSILNQIRIEIKNLNDGTPSEDQENIERFQYTGLDGQQHILNVFFIEGHPKYVYYTLNEDINNINTIQIIQSNQQNQNINPQSKNVLIIGINNENAKNNVNQINNHANELYVNTNDNQFNQEINQIFRKTQQTNYNNYIETNTNINSVFGGGDEILKLRNENNSLKEKNNELNSELQRLRTNLGNLYSSINQK